MHVLAANLILICWLIVKEIINLSLIKVLLIFNILRKILTFLQNKMLIQ